VCVFQPANYKSSDHLLKEKSMAIAATATPTQSKVDNRDWTKPAAMAIPKEGYFELQNL